MRDSGFDSVAAEMFTIRFQAVSMVIMVLISILIVRLWFLQIVNGSKYRTQSENNRIHLQKIPPFRGMIFDRNGELLVDNRPAYNLYVIPEDIQDIQKLSEQLHGLINLEPDYLREKLREASNRYHFKPVLLKRDMLRQELAVIETNLFNLPGISIQVEPLRNYVYGTFASHCIGYLGEISESQLKSGQYPNSLPGDFIGKSGVEGRWQQDLNGLRGGRQVEKDAAGRILRVISRKPPTPGLNIGLTLDKKLQLLAEKKLEGQKGAVVALNPENGEILAMASSPAFDPNLFVRGLDKNVWKTMITSKEFPMQNRAIAGQYPPGSIFKIIMAAAAFHEGIMTSDEEVFCSGSFRLGNRTYHCWKRYGHGKVNFHRAIVESCDVYFYQVGKQLGIDRIAQYAQKFGLGKKTDFNLTGEREGLVPTRQWKLKRWGEPWQKGETISLSIGQSFLLVTPLQMARAMAAVFNGGLIYQPELVRWTGKGDMRAFEFSPSVAGKIGAKPEHLRAIQEALVDVVHGPHGTGSRAKVDGIITAGKTGTVQVVSLSAQKEMEKQGEVPLEFRDHAWFVALARAEQKSISIAVLVENGGKGSTAAAPIAGELIKVYFGKQ